MKIVFIVNPKAGKGKGVDALIDEIYDAAKSRGEGAWVYETKAVKDAERFTSSYIRNNPKEEIHLYACGGDGTMNEVVNAVMRYQKETGNKNVSIGLVPIGSGNDFCKNFGSLKNALDFKKQLSAEPVATDVIRFTTQVDGKEETRYCVNMFNIGFDANVADMGSKLKKIPLMPAGISYLASVFTNLATMRGADIKVEVDGETVHEGPVFLTSIANGPYCGGGIKSNPTASIHDGIVDINVVSNVNRRVLLKLLPRYMKGTHMALKGIDKYIKVYTAKEVTVTPLQGEMKLCTDGEISVSGPLHLSVEQGAFTFLKPSL